MRDFTVMVTGALAGAGGLDLIERHYVAGAILIAIAAVVYGALTWRERNR